MIYPTLGNIIGTTQTDINIADGYSDMFHIGSYPLVSPICVFHNGATYTTGQGLDADNNPPKAIKYDNSTGVIEYGFVGDIDNNDPLTHNHPTILVIDDYVYIFVVNGHGEDIKIFKSNSTESVVDGFTLHHTIATYAVGYINVNYRDGVVNIHVRNTGDSPQYSSVVFYSDENDFTTWTKRTITDAFYGSFSIRHYPQNVEHYGLNKWHYFAVAPRYDTTSPETYYAHCLLKTQDFDTFYNLDETYSQDVTVNEIDHEDFVANYLIVGDRNAPFKRCGGANYIAINDVLYGSYYNYEEQTYKLIRIIKGVKTEYPLQLPVNNNAPSTDISQILLRYNGTNLIFCIRQDQLIGVSDLNFNNQQSRLKLFDNKTGDTIISYELPVNMQDVDGEYMIAGSDGFEESATEGSFLYQLLTDRFTINLNDTAPNAVSNLSSSGFTTTSVTLTWSAPTANTYPIAHYRIYVDGAYDGFTTGLTYSVTGLTVSQEYSFHVVAYDLNSNASEVSNILNATPDYDIPTGNLISYWNMDSDSTDQEGTNDGTDTSISYVSSGGIDNVADFTASTSSQISFGSPSDLKFGDGSTDSAFSLSFRVKFSSVASTTVCVDFRKSDNTNKVYAFFLEPGNTRFTFRMFDQSSGGLRDIYYNYSSVSTGTWYDVVITYDGSSTGVMYVDSDSESGLTDTGSYTAMETGTGNTLLLGKDNRNTTLSLNGYMDEVAFWDKELNSDEATSIIDKHTAGLALTE